MIAEDFIARLEKVRKTGDRQWSARCPAHPDKGPSLSIKDSDGKILINCFAGCGAADIVAAAGLRLSDLFPPTNDAERAIYLRERFTRATLKDLRQELTISLITLGDLVSGRPLKPQDMDRARRAKDSILKFIGELDKAA